MKNFFEKILTGGSRKTSHPATSYGVVSRRESDSVTIAAAAPQFAASPNKSHPQILLSELSRPASLEKLRLDGTIRTVSAGFSGRTIRLTDLQVEAKSGESPDLIKVGSDYINYLKRENIDLREKRVDFTIDAEGYISGTSVLAKDVEEASRSVEGFRKLKSGSAGSSSVHIETRGRAALRYDLWKLSLQEEEAFVAIAEESEEKTKDTLPAAAICLAVIEDEGYSIVFWEAGRGLFWEVEQPFVETELEDNLEIVADELRRLLNPTSLNSLELTAIDRLDIVASFTAAEFLEQELEEDSIYFNRLSIDSDNDYIPVDGSRPISDGNPVQAIIAAGLYLPDERIPAINLNSDLEEEIRNKENQRVALTQTVTKTASRNLAILLFAPVILAVLCIGIFW